MPFNLWIDTFICEKGISPETILTAEGRSGLNYIPVGSLVAAIKNAPKHERDAIKTTIAKIDFANGDVLHFFRHLAVAIAL